MLNKMVLEIDNFGIINQSKIEINQINIIGGVNSSGKSTSSKLLYSFLTSISKEGDFLANKSITERLLPLILVFKNIFEENSSVNQELDSLFRFCSQGDYNHVFNSLSRIHVEHKDKFENNKWITEDLESIKHTISLNESNKKYGYIMNVLLDSEFKLNQLQQNSKIRFQGKFGENYFDYMLKFSKNKLEGTLKGGYLNSFIFDQIIYIDSLAILDTYKNLSSDVLNIGNSIKTPFHIQDLSKKLKSEKEIDVYGDEFCKDMSNIKNELQGLIKGNIEFDSNQEEFIYRTENHKYPMSNTASGIKQIGILQILLDKCILKRNSFVFVDEPEVNLHPEWQVKFAKFIVLLAKKSNITFYINSHSPFFIEAMEVYSEYYDLVDKISFYLTQKDESSDKFIFTEISRDNLPILYNNLGDPYDIIDEIRAKNLFNRNY